MSLKDRTAVISGAGGELGTVLARGLAAQGANLALLGRSAEKLEAARAALALPDARVLVRRVDLSDPTDAAAAAAAVAAKFARVDALLHVVGGWAGGKTLLEADPADLQSMLEQHVWTSFHAVRAFLPHLLAGGWGRVIMISSPFAARPNAKGGPYAIGKAGQEALMLTLSQELRGTGVTANLLLARSIDVQREKLSAPSSANASWTSPEELSAAVLYLLSEEAGAVNGAKIPMFGAYG
jgi:NAD(P)-dependent dehydrogenase (short-subunit alcohol dehydrogenase family)